MQMVVPKQWTEAADTCFWIRECLEEWEKNEKSWGEGQPYRRTSSLNLSGPMRSLKHWTTKQATFTSWCEAPNTHTIEDCQVYVHSGMMHLILTVLYAPGNLEVRKRRGGHIHMETDGGVEVWEGEKSVDVGKWTVVCKKSKSTNF